ncbi:charged multivesicular body protein 7 isoform X2 [Pararge aegeria]|uniref:charged multivesicular body protein 7 isoform X2 n=1 Tax=Pararge aegeria TaxID=116150 RepID=UPI0019D2AF3B|nr:charged multivesicular body protein 7 isoform X2 [Pararge aegeria]
MGIADCYPEEKLPQCWSDDVRMNALFAPFRLKSANPESWEMKMKFWSDMVRQWCRFKMDPIVSAGDVKCVFQRRGRTAACLDIVIEEMFRSGELSPISKYQQILHNGPEGWVKWGARLAFKPAALALTAVTSLLPARQAMDANGLPKASIDSTQRFVLESAVKDQAIEFLNNFPPGEDRIGTIEELMRTSNYTNREVCEILLGYLVSQGMAVKQGDVVKLAEPNKKVAPVTELDEALVKLMSTETRLSGEMARLTREVASADVEVRAAMKLGNKLVAKNHLRKKLKAQQRLDRCEGALENIRELVLQAKNTDFNTTVVDTYRTSAQAMKRTMKEGGLEEDEVYNTMDNLKEVMESYSEVEKALGGTLDELDTTELEQELNDLLAGTGGTGGTPGKEEKSRVGQKLPSPPGATTRRPGRKIDRDFVFDGEERMLADLNELGTGGVADEAAKKIAVAEAVEEPQINPKKKEKPTKDWDPTTNQSVSDTWSNKLDTLAENYGELRKDNRLHPGQPLDVDFTTPPQHYNAEFQVQDHKSANGIWLFNSKDGENLTPSTEYSSSESPGKSSCSNFQMAPGGERRKPDPWPKDDNLDDLERRLKNLRGFNL